MPFSLAYKGFDYVSYYNGAYENADSLLDLSQTGANSASLNLEYGIDVNNSTVYADANYTDSLTALGNTITEAKNLGLTVMVKPLIDFLDPTKIGSNSVGDWRAYYNPADPAAFFASYKAMIVSEAQVAQAHGATLLSIGTELDQLTGPQYLSYWTDIISAVRAVFSGQLTYSADWNDDTSPWQGHNGLAAGTGDLATQVSFWSQLDYVGLDVYAPLSDAANPTLADLIAGWNQVPTDPESHAVTGDQSLISYFESVAAQTGKPLLFTEIGYESATDAASQPAGSSTNVYDPALQANLYTAFFGAWKASGDTSLDGVFFWNWDPNTAEVGPGNGANFSPQGLPAEDVVKANFMLTAAVPGDFNGDGKADILWQNDSGQPMIWTMNGTTVTGTSTLANPGAGWHIREAADFNGDGNPDILWQNDNGLPVIWTMDGTMVTGGVALAGPGPGWHIMAAADFNGDGKADILWQNDNGLPVIWTMNGTTVTAGAALPNPGPDWHIMVAADFNGDGKADILWQNDNGQPVIWTMDGTTVTGGAALSNPGADWHLI